MSDWELLQAYAMNRSETAFAELVRLHVDWVHSVALRHVGDPHLAEDVVQSVFVLLARKARDLRPGTVLGGWLFRTTCHVAAHARRAEQRRKSREATACTMSHDTNSPDSSEILWQQLAPHLDLAVSALSESDRSAILLRFYEKAPMSKVGERLGVSEDAAKKRVSRAVERMRDFLAERGVKIGGVVLAGMLAEKTVQAAPAAMAAAVAKIAMAATAASSSVMLPPLAQETLRAWHWAKAKLVAGLAVSSMALILVIAGMSAVLGSHSVSPSMAANGSHGGDAARQDRRPSAQGKTGAVAARLPHDSVLSPDDTDNLSFTGRVIDKFTGEPVQGATVRVRREISSSTDHRVLEETEHLTDANGQFTFGLTPEQSTNRSTYLNFEVVHPNYARRPWDGYALTMIRTNESLGERPFFEHLDLAPAEGISGTLLRPDGAPAAGVKVLTYSKAVKTDMSDYGSFAETNTDVSGTFHINVVKGGEAVLWLLPQDFVPSTHLIHQQRGDLGQFALEDGVRLTGQVFDSDGLPVSHVWVNAELSGGPAKKPIGMPVADALSRSALTDEQGQFATGPLPVGDYYVLISEYPRDNLAQDRTRYPVSDVFMHQRVRIEGGQATQSMEIRAVPHVVLGIQQLDGQGNPHKTHEVNVSGRLGDTGWWGEGRPDQDGRIAVKVPQGLADVRIGLLVNEHQSTRYRWSNDSPWRNENEITAAILDHDTNEISVMYYTAPILLVRATAEDGSAIPAFKCQVTYANDRKPYTQPPHWINGDSGDVNFEKQQDGRWRSQSLLPNEDLSLTVEAEGFQTWSQSINLAEGASQEIEAKLVSK
jgi:RNA polymerase sigma factor (sigma-70 family)